MGPLNEFIHFPKRQILAVRAVMPTRGRFKYRNHATHVKTTRIVNGSVTATYSHQRWLTLKTPFEPGSALKKGILKNDYQSRQHLFLAKTGTTDSSEGSGQEEHCQSCNCFHGHTVTLRLFCDGNLCSTIGLIESTLNLFFQSVLERMMSEAIGKLTMPSCIRIGNDKVCTCTSVFSI
jgi:hypothetical protein